MQQLLPVYMQPVREGRVQVTDKGAAQHLYTEATSHVQASHAPSCLALLQSSGNNVASTGCSGSNPPTRSIQGCH